MSGEFQTESVGPEAPPRPGRIELLAFGTELAQRFEIVDVLGTGGYAVVYRAKDRLLGREVALKVLRHDRISPSVLKRLRREAAIARDVVHDRLVRIFDIEESAEAVFLTMEVVEGGSLGERLTDGAISIDQAVAWAGQALEGLAALHGLGILHRDIKPGNLLIGANGAIKVSDFGLALNVERDETRATTHESVLGTLEYLSPEQALGQPVDVRSDLYSLGVVLYEMVAGRLPFESHSSLGSLLERLKKEVLPGLRESRPETPAWLAATVARLLARRPEDRYPSADSALRELRERSARRRRTAAGALPVVMAALLLLAAGGWLAREHWRSRFSHIVDVDESAVKAVDRAGRTLWARSDVTPTGNFSTLRTRRHGDVLASVLTSHGEPIRRETAILDLVDPQSGASLERVPLPTGHGLFPTFSDSYGFWLRPLDLGGDGVDELIVTFVHTPFYPSYSVLVEPDGQRARVVFAGAGHHTLAAIADLDSDGHEELIFSGVNNRMGWALGLAAVRVDPWVGEPSSARIAHQLALGPDLFWGVEAEGVLEWYSLLPGNRQHARGSPLRVDPGRRELLFEPDHGAPIRLSFDGFLAEAPSPLPVERREALRRSAYSRMREGQRFLTTERPAEAELQFEAALADAREAADPALAEWLERLVARATLRAGRIGDGLARFSALHARTESPSEVGFEAARTLHGLGRLPEAIEWYRLALGKGALPGVGRNKFELLQGLTFALVELRRYDEARAECERFSAAYPQQIVRAERAFVAWRSNELRSPEVFDDAGGLQDLHRYWWLELRLLRGDSPGELLQRLRDGRSLISEYHALFDGLEAELSFRLDASANVLPLARRALDDARRLAASEPNYRVHLPILEQRLRRLERRR